MATTAASRPQPVSDTQLQQLAQDACNATLSTATSYTHASTESWNSSIISKILNSLITASQNSSSSEQEPSQQYKYAVNSTIIQHLSSSSSGADSLTPSTDPTNSTTASTQTTTAGNSVAALDGSSRADGSAAGQTVSPPSTPTQSQNGGTLGASSGANAVQPQKGRRGMHSATGAYWNNETDGMWNFKWEGGESKGMDVVVSVIWVAI